MSEKLVWLFSFVLLYWGYCIYWGVKSARTAHTASDYFLAGRRIGLWVFVLAATATSFSGWTFMGHPGLVYRDGFQYAYASFYAITIPFTGLLFLKRQWLLGRRFGYVTPGEMLSDYFQGDLIRILTVLVALLFSIPYLGVQLGASGFLFDVLSDGVIGRTTGMWLLSLVVLIYVALGGLRAVAYVDTLQCVLLALGIVITGGIALHFVGGWGALNEGFADLAASGVGKWGSTKGYGGGDYNAYFAIPGVIQFTAGIGKEAPVGGLWTGFMILTYMFALMGIQSSPAFSMWAFANKDPRPFAPQQVWASALGIGGIMILFTAIQGMGAHLLGANPIVNEAGLALSGVMDGALPDILDVCALLGLAADCPEAAFRSSGQLIAAEPDSLVPHYFNLIAAAAPWLVGLLAVCALAAMQSTGAAYMATASSMLTRDLYKRFLNRQAGHATQKRVGRIGVAVIVMSALLVATFSGDALVLLGGLAVAFGFQMWLSLIAVCWSPWISRQGATWGLIAGLLGVILTEKLGISFAAWLGWELPWGRWPWTIHSAGWGMCFNLLVCGLVSACTQSPQATRHRMKFHDFLRRHAALPGHKRRLVPWAWALTLLWFCFAIGPGAVLGNWIFGAPDAGTEGWLFGIPSIWAWQILFWGLGVLLMWFLAYKMELSTVPGKEVEALTEDIGDAPEGQRSGLADAAATTGAPAERARTHGLWRGLWPARLSWPLLLGVALVSLLLVGKFQDRPPGDLATELGAQRLEDGLYTEALTYFETALRRAPGHRGARMGKALVFLQSDHPTRALEEFDLLITQLRETLAEQAAAPNKAQDPTGRGVLAAAYANRGVLQDRVGLPHAALRDYLRALATDPEAVSGPGLGDKILRGRDRFATIRERARYLYQQLRLPVEERLLRVPELDALQVMYKP